MDAFVPRLSLWWIFFGYLCFAASGAEAYQKNITAESGQDVNLTCRAPNNKSVEWSRADLGDKYVLVYRDGKTVPDDQHPSFKNRVDLQDGQMKDGDVSLILKNVTINDTGTYECRVLKDNIELVSIIYLHVDPPGQKTISAKPGQKNVTLPCQVPNNNITAVEWSRADLKPEYVLVYQDGHFDSDKQHPSFENRVDLQDKQMKDGDVALILKNVTINDTGTYECRVNMSGGNTDPICIIYLRVVPPGQTGGDTEDGSVGLKVGLPVAVVVVVVVALVGVVIYRKCK